MPDPLDVFFDFVRRPSPVPATLRPEWRIASLLLALRQCWGNKATRRQLHVLNWALRTPETRTMFAHVIAGNLRPDEAIVRFDPVVDRALQFAEGEKLVTVSGDLVALTMRGEELVKSVMRNKDCMVTEKEFLTSLGRKLTQVQVDAFFSLEVG
jgi:hypothetical protein